MGLLFLFVHGKRALFLLVHGSLHIGEEGLEQLLCALDVLVDGLVQYASCLPLFLHQVVLLFVDLLQLETNQAFPHVFAVRPVPAVLHHRVEGVASEESSSAGLDSHSHGYQVATLALHKRLRVVVPLSADRAESFFDPFVTLEPLEILKTRPVVHVTATEDILILELQVFEADRTRLINLASLEKVAFDATPLALTKRFGWFVNKAQALSQTQIVNVLHPFLFNIVVRALLAHFSI